MSNKPKVFIVILNFNSYEDTIQCVNSLKKVQYDNFEVVIVDNASKDNSYERLISEIPDYSIIRSEKNLGYANGNNIGIKYALDNGADYVCILNNDVEVEQNFLSKLVEVMESDRSIGMTGPCICEFGKRDIIQAMGATVSLYTGVTSGINKGKYYSKVEKENLQVNCLYGTCFVIRREVFEKISLIPEDYFLFFEETEFCVKAKNSGFKLVCVYDSVVYHKGSSTIKKFQGLYYFFINRNRVIFIRRNSNTFQKLVFSIYIFIEAVGRMIIRREPFLLIKNIIAGFKADKANIDIASINKYIV